jgi:hypothetical protein
VAETRTVDRPRTRERVYEPEPTLEPSELAARLSSTRGRPPLRDLPWSLDLTLVGGAMGMGMTLGALPEILAMLGVPSMGLGFFAFLTVALAMNAAMHTAVGLASGVAAKATMKAVQPRTLPRRGLAMVGVVAGGTAAGAEYLTHLLFGTVSAGVGGHLYMAVGWGLTAALAVVVSSVYRSSGRPAGGVLLLLGLLMGVLVGGSMSLLGL